MPGLDDVPPSNASAAVVLPPIEYRGLTQLAIDALRRAILMREFRPGQQLDFPKLASQLQVSPTPLKEAARFLATQGLLEINPRRGTFVRPLTERSLREAVEARLAVELWAVERYTPEHMSSSGRRIDKLVSEAAKVVANLNDSSINRWAELDAQFHRELVVLAGNQLMLRFYDSLGAVMMLTRAVIYRRSTSRIHQSQDDHESVLGYLLSGERKPAAERLEQHISKALDEAVEGIRSEGGTI